MIDDLKLNEIGEKNLIKELTALITPDTQLVDGLGNDSAFLDFHLSTEELLMLNTDRSGMNIAYKLGLSKGTSVVDFAVSHAVSDIFAAGGRPLAISVALILPQDLNVGFVKEIMRGANTAARKYGAFIACGDTKHGNKFAAVVTVLGKCLRSDRLIRSGAKPKDLIIAVGEFGSMLAGVLAFKHNLNIGIQELKHLEHSVIFQNPPYKLSLAMSGKHLAHASIDNSDGLAGSIHALCEASQVGAILYKDKIPISQAVRTVATMLNLDPLQMCFGSGDWQHIFAVSEDQADEFITLASQEGYPATIIGNFNSAQGVYINSSEGTYELPCIANDRFGLGGMAWFNLFENNINFRGAKVK